MPTLPYHEDNQVRKDIAFNHIASWAQKYLDNAITAGEFAGKIIDVLMIAGVKWDQES